MFFQSRGVIPQDNAMLNSSPDSKSSLHIRALNWGIICFWISLGRKSYVACIKTCCKISITHHENLLYYIFQVPYDLSISTLVEYLVVLFWMELVLGVCRNDHESWLLALLKCKLSDTPSSGLLSLSTSTTHWFCFGVDDTVQVF